MAYPLREDMERLKAAFDRVADRPEFLPNERVYWLDLRAAVEKVLERYDPKA